MSDNKPEIPRDASGEAFHRAMGHPLVVDNLYLGKANKYVDIFDLSGYGERAFYGISIQNPSTSQKLYIAFGPSFTENKVLTVPVNCFLTIDHLSFGPGFADIVSGLRTTKIRAALGGNAGTLATGTLDFSASANPANGDLVTINGTVFEFSNDASVAPGRVKVDIGGSKAATLSNLITAINNNEQSVTASLGGDVLTNTSNYGGTTGNGITQSTNVAGAVASGANLTLGASGELPIIQIW